jgi:hypothetical protein
VGSTPARRRAMLRKAYAMSREINGQPLHALACRMVEEVISRSEGGARELVDALSAVDAFLRSGGKADVLLDGDGPAEVQAAVTPLLAISRRAMLVRLSLSLGVCCRSSYARGAGVG